MHRRECALVKRKWVDLKAMAFLFYIIVVFIVGASLFINSVYNNLPDVKSLKGCLTTTMFQVRLCPTDAGYTKLNGVADIFLKALIATEDAAFFNHKGFDWEEMKKSFAANMEQKRFARGGSTITQQLAKNVFLNADKTIVRKVQEAILASRIEDVLTKNSILERYVNVVEFGPKIYGIRKASEHYFFKSPVQLHLLEAAYLTHLLPNPKVYSRTFDKGQLTEFSRKRVLTIARALLFYGHINAQQMKAARLLVNRFPWHDLSEVESGWLRGEGKPDFHVPDVDETFDPRDLTETEPEEVEDESITETVNVVPTSHQGNPASPTGTGHVLPSAPKPEPPAPLPATKESPSSPPEENEDETFDDV